jgi:hypothetical protein
LLGREETLLGDGRLEEAIPVRPARWGLAHARNVSAPLVSCNARSTASARRSTTTDTGHSGAAPGPARRRRRLLARSTDHRKAKERRRPRHFYFALTSESRVRVIM